MHTAADGGSQQLWARPPDGGADRLRLVPTGDHEPDSSSGGSTDQRGDDDARAALVELYLEEYAQVARLAYLLVGDHHLAEDLAHDAFVKLYEHWDDVEDRSKSLAYLRATTSNLAMSVHRRSKTARKHLASPWLRSADGPAASAEATALASSARPDVVAALQELSPKQRAAVVLKHWLRMTESEIAEALGCSVGSARTHIARGHSALAAKRGGHR